MTNQWYPNQIIIELFSHLRSCGFSLGLRELLVAQQAISDGWGADSPDSLRPVVRLLWCSSLSEIGKFEVEWARLIGSSGADTSVTPSTDKPLTDKTHLRPIPEDGPDDLPLTATPPPNLSSDEFIAMPIQAPFVPAALNEVPDLYAYWPLSRREMSYAWRYLRRPVADGPLNVLDLPATVEQTVRQGFFLSPVYRRHKQNHAHLVLILDQNGSMMPFHRFTRDLVSTAQASTAIQRLDLFYFQNVPTDHLYKDQRLTQPISIREALADCDQDSSLIIVSDAGAARGYRRLERIQTTIRFLRQLRSYSSLIAWFNPLPAERWPGSSAQIIAYQVPMFQMDADGVASAVDIVRGQISHTH